MKKKQKTAKRPRHASPEGDGTAAFSALARSVGIALLPTLLCGTILLLIGTAILLSLGDPGRYAAVVGHVLLYLTAFVGAGIATRLHARRAPLFCGLLFGLCLVVLWVLLSRLLPESWHGTVGTAAKVGFYALLVPVALAGAFLAARRSKKRKNRRK